MVKQGVSWAGDDKLVNIKYIENRLERFKTWDPDNMETLPFSTKSFRMHEELVKEETEEEEIKNDTAEFGKDVTTTTTSSSLSEEEEVRRCELLKNLKEVGEKLEDLRKEKRKSNLRKRLEQVQDGLLELRNRQSKMR